MRDIALPQDPVPARVNVYVTRDIAFNLDKMFQVTKAVLGKLGCDHCHSGRVLDFRIIEDFIVDAQTGKVVELPGRPHL